MFNYSLSSALIFKKQWYFSQKQFFLSLITWCLGNKDNNFLQLYHAFHQNDTSAFHQLYTAWWCKHLRKRMPKVKDRNKLRYLYLFFKRLQLFMCCLSTCGSCWLGWGAAAILGKGMEMQKNCSPFLTEILWLLKRVTKDSLNILEKRLLECLIL